MPLALSDRQKGHGWPEVNITGDRTVVTIPRLKRPWLKAWTTAIQDLAARALDDKNTFDPPAFWIDPHLKHSATSDSGPPRLDGIVRKRPRKNDSFHLASSKRLTMKSSGGTRGSRAELSQERENGRNRQEGSHKHCDARASLRRIIVNRAASSTTALKELGEALVELAAGIEARGELRHNLRHHRLFAAPSLKNPFTCV